MRVDRLLTLYFFHLLRNTSLRRKGIRVPILMYHSISDTPEEVSHPYFKTNTSPHVFAEHMRILREHSYSVISLSSAVELLAPDSEPTTGKPVVLTFDDGFADFRTQAFPLLREFGFCATVFLPTGFISDEGRNFNSKRCLRWNEIRELAGSGIQFGTHTVTHPQLRDLHWDQIEREIRESTKALEDEIGKQVESFSYPYAFPEEDRHLKARLKTLLVELGYKNGVTTRIGTATKSDDRLFLRRIPANSGVDPVFFRAKLAGGYDWMKNVQYGYKLINTILR